MTAQLIRLIRHCKVRAKGLRLLCLLPMVARVMRFRTSSDPTPKQLREAAAAAPPDPAYLDDLRRFGIRPSPEIKARGWKRWRTSWQWSKAGRPYLELSRLRVIVFDNRTIGGLIPGPAKGTVTVELINPDLRAPFTVGFGHDDGSGLTFLIGGASTEEEAMQIGSAVALAFEEAGHAPKPWLYPEKSPRLLAWRALGNDYAERLCRDWDYSDQLDRETAAWRERQWREKAAIRAWEQERKRS
jgi:hypothetical protein